jgi:hypothetical protein
MYIYILFRYCQLIFHILLKIDFREGLIYPIDYAKNDRSIDSV